MMQVGMVQFQSAPYRDVTFKRAMDSPSLDLTIGLFPITYNTHPEWQYSCTDLHEVSGIAVDDFLRSKTWDVISICGYSEPAAKIALRYCFSRGIPVVLQADTVEQGRLPFFKRQFYKRINAFWVPGKCSKRYFLSMGVPDEKIYLGSYTYDYSEIRSSVRSIDRRAVRLSMGLADDDFVLLFIGKLISSRRIDLLLESFERISEPSLKLVVVGDGEGSSLLQYAVRTDDRITWVSSVPLRDLYEYYAIADCYVHPGKEPFSCAVMQAVASGLPVVASSAVGAVSDFLVDGFNGRFIELGSSDSLTSAIHDTFENSDALLLGAQKTQEQVCENLGIEFAAEQLLSAFEHAISCR
ncbi:glycosyltransferase [Adlercreutzia sp. ZJ242]|uniref:glycosyltransferase n=1 Tax=Adlercreutzia sp. ZJ242 TaxID=2709409 RepID=UPI0013EDFF11|nr:glycosyltransferase [Adlercreutzia sp. ZJ242]